MQKIKENKFIIALFALILIIGLITFRDYGISNDEYIQKSHSIINSIAYIEAIDNLNLPNFIDNKISKLLKFYNVFPRIKSYEYKYYGVAIQLPFALLDVLTYQKIDAKITYYIRHLFCFITFFISLIYFYLILNKYIIKNKKYSILGTLFLLLSPRIYGEVFYNIKDTLFMSLFIINCYYIIKYLNNNNNNNKLRTIIQLAFITAITINSRVVGGIAIFIGIILKIIYDRKEIKSTLFSIFLVTSITLIIYYIVTPASWYNILTFPFETLNFFFNYTDPINHTKQICFYFGKWIDSTKLPWHYLPVWIYITTPILYIVSFLIGIFKNTKEIIKNKFKIINKNLLFLNLILIVMLIFICIFRPTLYGGWRHMYFIYPIIIINSTIGYKYIIEQLKKYKNIIYGITILNSFFLILWMIINHPYQNEYFHFPLRNYYSRNFEINYSRISNTEAIRYIAKIDKSRYIKVFSSYNNSAHRLLNKKDKKRINITNKTNNANYIIDNSIKKNKNLEKQCKIIKIKHINGVRLYTIYNCGYK